MELTPTTIEMRDLQPGDADWLIRRHAELYAESDGFDATFGPFVADILAAYVRDRDPARERFWIAQSEGRRLGSICCARSGEQGVAKLRLFLVEPEARGLGLGQRLLSECIDYARATGNHTLRLWTHESHRAACALYGKNGFVCTKSAPVTSFGVPLVEQTWELHLA